MVLVFVGLKHGHRMKLLNNVKLREVNMIGLAPNTIICGKWIARLFVHKSISMISLKIMRFQIDAYQTYTVFKTILNVHMITINHYKKQ